MQRPCITPKATALKEGEPGYSEVTKDHGRIEKREAWLSTDISWFAGKQEWEGLKGFGGVHFSRTVKGEASHCQ